MFSTYPSPRRPTKSTLATEVTKKVEQRPRAHAKLASTGATDVEEASASTVAAQEDQTREDSLEAEYREERKELAAVAKLARAAAQKAAVDVRKAEAGLRREQRLEEERGRRWDAAERRQEPPPAYLQLERVYRSQVRLLEARLELSKAETRAAEAWEELQGCLLLQEEAAHVRMCVRSCVGSRVRVSPEHISGVLESLSVILGVLSVPKRGGIAWYQ